MGAMLTSEPIKRKRLYEEVQARLEHAILSGARKPGEQLPSEREIMEAYGVGRTAVREALFALQKDGLVRLSSGQRAVVVEPSAAQLIEELAGPARHVLSHPERLRQLQSARIMLESFLAREAARQAGPDAVARIREALEANKAAIGDADAFIATNIEFHREIALVSGNMFISALHDATERWLREHRRVAIRSQGADQQAYRRHVEILAAIEAGDGDAAENAMRAHLNDSVAAYWAVNGDEPVRNAG